MKKSMILLCMTLSLMGAEAQNWSEWMQQKQTQVKYLLEQIAALKAYTGYLEKGYDMAHKGLSTIHRIKNGDFSLHEGYFASLKKVNPIIKNSSQAIDIISLNLQIGNIYKKSIAHIKKTGQFTSEEKNYYTRVFLRVLADAAAVVDDLSLLTLDEGLEMSDDQRMERIEKLRREMVDTYCFARHFSRGAEQIAGQRRAEQGEVHTMQQMMGVH